jgi:hypothetical protein
MRLFRILTVSSLFIMVIAMAAVAAAEDVPRMSKEELKGMMDNPDLIIVDIRSGRDWSSSESKITGAVREEPRKADAWADKYEKDNTLVLYCA